MGTRYVAMAVLKFTMYTELAFELLELSLASLSQVLGLKEYMAIPGFLFCFVFK